MKDFKVATYLLTWNPAKWNWDNLEQDIDNVNQRGYSLSTWSCGVTKKIVPGDRVFLIKLGKEEPRGIMASGWVTSEFFEDLHYDEDAALAGKTALYVNIHFDTILDPEMMILPRNQLAVCRREIFFTNENNVKLRAINSELQSS